MIINPDQDYPYQMNIELLKKESDETDILEQMEQMFNEQYLSNF